MKQAIALLLVHLFFLSVAYTQKQHSVVAVQSWLTTAEGSKRLERQPDILLTPDTAIARGAVLIYVDDKITYQQMDGFGAAMTGTAAYVLNSYLNKEQREKLMTELFSREGIRLSFVRQMIGASGYEIGGDYSYDDMPAGKTDTALRHFNIERDQPDVIPMLKEALAKNSQLKIFGSPCSAPGWMKNTGSMRGTGNAFLLPRYYPAYAAYFVKYIQAYAKEGIPLYGVTIQNEPEYGPTTYPGMIMPAEAQADFVKNHLGPAFSRAKIKTKIIVFDHNWGLVNPNFEKGFNYPIEVLDDPAAKKYIAGTGFHNYGGNGDLQAFVHDRHPDKHIWFTEGSGGEWIGGFPEGLKEFVSRVIIGSVRNWSKGVCLWNLVLDKNNLLQKAKAEADQNCVACYGLVMIDTAGNITRMPEYYALAHASKFVAPGAKRIASNSLANSIENVAFKNPDGSKVLLVINKSKEATTFKVNWTGKSFQYSLGAGDVVTLVWQ